MANWQDVQEAVILRQQAPYAGVIFDVVEFDPRLYILMFYADNLADFSDHQLVSIAEWIQHVLDDLNAAHLGRQYTYQIGEHL